MYLALTETWGTPIGHPLPLLSSLGNNQGVRSRVKRAPKCVLSMARRNKVVPRHFGVLIQGRFIFLEEQP